MRRREALGGLAVGWVEARRTPLGVGDAELDRNKLKVTAHVVMAGSTNKAAKEYHCRIGGAVCSRRTQSGLASDSPFFVP